MKALNTFIETRGASVHPLLFLVVCILAFGLFVPFLGFYWDDWPTIFYTYNQRVGQLVTHFSYDRPFSVWGYWLIGRLGSAPLTWHLAALLVRWGCVLALAWALKPLWPRNARLILFVGLLFAIYPGFYLQPSSVIFSSHLLAYLFFLISLGCMGRAATTKERFWVYTAIGLAAAAVHMFTLEYFVGLELVRPFYLWFLIFRNKAEKTPMKRMLSLWAPYLLLFGLWVMWRMFLVNLPVDPYPLVTLSALSSNPIEAALELIRVAAQDLSYILVLTWKDTLLPGLFGITSTMNTVAWIFAGGCFLLIWWLLAKITKGKDAHQVAVSEERRNAMESLVLGAVALVSGLMPIWLIGERIAQGDYNLRYILVALFGAALVVAALISWLPSARWRVVVVSLLVALALGNHLRAGAEYKQDWEAQREFYWQLSWRAPGFEANTALVAFEPVSKYLRDPMTGNALNVLYPTAGEAPTVGLWNFQLNRTQTASSILNGEPLQNEYRGLVFKAESSEDLIFYYQASHSCLWLLRPQDVDNNALPIEHRELVTNSNLANIVPEAGQAPPTYIFGAEPERDWCYYFEKADLAAQLGEWDTVIELMEQARELGLRSKSAFEWLPLLEAQAGKENWEEAISVSKRVDNLPGHNNKLLCAVWDSILVRDSGEAAQAAYLKVSPFANCESQ